MGYFDWAYLDTSHEEQHTARELELLRTKVKPGGWILGDDWFESPDHPFFGEVRAIRAFCTKYEYELAYANNTDHQWALQLPNNT